ncbi:MAG: hypothetical protein ACFCU6_02470, partial [Balneolaceae bacterium]
MKNFKLIISVITFLLTSIAFIGSGYSQNTVDVTFRYVPGDNAVRSFVPGSFNNWGNNVNGQISATDGSLLTEDPEGGFSFQVVELEVGGGNITHEGITGYAYKFHEHFNESGTQWEWFTDPLNPIAIGQFSDSFIEITHPLIFQMEPLNNSIQSFTPPSIFANVAAMASDPIDIDESKIIINGEPAGSFNGFYENERQLLFVSSISDLGVTLLDGINTITIQAKTESGASLEKTHTFTFTSPDVVEEQRPPGLEDGITYDESDPSKVSFSIFAPGKEFVYVIGDHSDWEIRDEFLMKKDAPRADSVHFWIEIEGFTPGEQSRFQYLVDGNIRLADLYSELVLDPANDQFIPENIFPDLPPYPTGLTSEIVTVIEPGREPY